MPRPHYILPAALLAGCAGSPVVTGSYPAAPVGDMSFQLPAGLASGDGQGPKVAHFSTGGMPASATVSLKPRWGKRLPSWNDCRNRLL